MTVRHLARGGAIVATAFLVSRILGWLRLAIIGNLFFGQPSDLDAYFAAFRVPDLIYQLVAAGAIGSAMVPIITGLIHDGEEDRVSRVVSSVMNAMLVTLALLAVLVFVFAPWIVPLLVPGFDAATTEATVHLTRIMVIAPVLLAMGAVASSALNARGRFVAAAMAPLLYNLAIIVCAIVLKPALGIDALAVGTVIGAGLFLVVQIRPLVRFLRYQPILDRADAAFRRIIRLLIPRSLSLAASQITFVVNTLLASLIAVGAVTLYTIATTIFTIPVGVMAWPMAIILLPSLSRATAAGDRREFGSLLIGGLRLLCYVMVFLSAVGIVLSRDIVDLLFDYGAFDEASLEITSQALAVMLLGLAANAICLLQARAFFSRQDTTIPLLGVVLCVVVNVVVSVATFGSLGLVGLAAGVVLGDMAEAVFLTVVLWRREPSIGMAGFVRVVPVMVLGAALAGVAAYAASVISASIVGADPGKVVLLLQMIVATAVGGAAYVGYTVLTRLPELPRAISLARASIARQGVGPD